MGRAEAIETIAVAATVAALAFWIRRKQSLRKCACASTVDAAREAISSTWDYIIVGGGTAGCLLANRLIAGTGKKVLVLEAGQEDYWDRRIQIPAGVLELFQSRYDWNFTSTTGNGTSGVYLCRGKVLGGSSSLNVLLYTRGDSHDYDLWETKFGCKGWKGNDVLPYFCRTQDDQTGFSSTDTKHHSTGGEWAVDNVRYQNVLSKCFLKACAEAGLPANKDFNNWDRAQVGIGRFTVSQRNGARCSAASAFLAPAFHKAAQTSKRLRVLCGVRASKIKFDEHCVATGVDFFSADGARHFAGLVEGGEVILTAGAIHSPQLLLLSGVGPAEHLKEHGIPVISNLGGVGSNLQDHPAVNVSYQCPRSQRGVSPTSHCFFIGGKKIPHPMWILRWLLFRSGPLTSPGCDHGGFLRTAAADPSDSPSPDLQFRFLPARAVTADGMNSFATFRTITDLPDGFSVQSIAVRPHSRGCVRLASRSVYDKPIVNGNYLGDKRDVATLREGIRLARKVSEQKAFAKFRGIEVFPGPEVQSDEQLDAYIADTVHTANALVGTCRMGSAGDPQAVCDPEMRVLGVQGLRVCDSSVMPKLPGGQSGAPTVMIAERAADFILHRNRS